MSQKISKAMIAAHVESLLPAIVCARREAEAAARVLQVDAPPEMSAAWEAWRSQLAVLLAAVEEAERAARLLFAARANPPLAAMRAAGLTAALASMLSAARFLSSPAARAIMRTR